MIAEERKLKLLEIINKDRFVKVDKLASMFNVSEMTIRRDLNELNRDGKVNRVFGGAVLTNPLNVESLFDDKRKNNLDVKKKIANKALELISDNMTIFLDGGSTTYELALNIKSKQFKNLTIITNDLNIAYLIHKIKSIRLIIIGGIIQYETGLALGYEAVNQIKALEFDITFLGMSSINKNFYMATPTSDKVEIKRSIINSSRKVVLLTDKSKFNNRSLFSIDHINNIDLLITDRKFTNKELKILNKIELINI